MSKFFKPIKYIIALVLGHYTVFKHVFKKPVTLEYPEKKPALNSNFRGVHALVHNEESGLLCTACGTCQRVCPSFGTIEIEKAKDEDGKFYPKNYSINLNKCIFCGNCVNHCPFGAIVMSKEFELATEDKSALTLDINALKNNYTDNIINKQGKGDNAAN